jgi:HK97 gp10 family phage protein
MDVNVKVTGTEEVINKIQKFNDIAYSELGLKMVEVVESVMTDAKSFAPFDTGFLREHITGRVISKIRGVIIIGQIRSSARYSIYQEFGWSGQPEGHPFLVPAINKNKALMFEKFKRAMDEAITKAAVGKYYGGGKKGILTDTWAE